MTLRFDINLSIRFAELPLLERNALYGNRIEDCVDLQGEVAVENLAAATEAESRIGVRSPTPRRAASPTAGRWISRRCSRP